MAARSTGLFTREGFNLDAEMQVPENAGGTDELLGDLSNAKTIRIILINPLISGDAEITIDFDTANSISRTYDVSTPYTEPGSNIIIDHIRGALLDGKTQDVAYQVFQNTGGASVDGVYLELVDRASR